MNMYTYLLTPQQLLAIRVRRHYRYFRMQGLAACRAFSLAKRYACES